MEGREGPETENFRLRGEKADGKYREIRKGKRTAQKNGTLKFYSIIHKKAFSFS